MPNDPKIDHLLELVTSMTRAKEQGHADFDEKSKADRLKNLMIELHEMLNKHVLEKGLSTSDILISLRAALATGLSLIVRDKDILSQILFVSEWNIRFMEICADAIIKNQEEKKS